MSTSKVERDGRFGDHFKKCLFRVIGILAVSSCLGFPSHLHSQSEETTNLAKRISQRPIFQHRTVWVGSEPIAAETKDLWAALEPLRQGEIEAGLDSLEDYIATHPASPWTPSLRSNLARYYREHGRYTPALQH